MSGGLLRAWRQRAWYDVPLTVLGLALTALAILFWIETSFAFSATQIRYGGLFLLALGLWMLVIRHLVRRRPPEDPEADEVASD